MVSAGRVQTLLMCAKAQERRAMIPDRFSVGYIRLGTRLVCTRHSSSALGTRLNLQYRSAFQSSNLTDWVRVNLGCCQANGAYALSWTGLCM